MRLRRVLLLALMMLPLGHGVTLAHGDISSSVPPADETVKKPPDHIIINFTEPPAKSSVVKVTEGCGKDITDNVVFDDNTGHVFMDKGQPGQWKVSYEVLSAADGHKTNGNYGFTVKGKKDCSPDEPADNGGNENNNGGEDSGNGSAAGPTGEGDDDGSSLPIVPIAIGTVAVVGLALVARRFAS